MHSNHPSHGSTHSNQQINNAPTASLLESSEDVVDEVSCDEKEKINKVRDSNGDGHANRPKYFQRGISISDNAISSHQFSSSFIVSKLSGVLSTLLELGERAPSNRGSAVLTTPSRIPYMSARFETPTMRRVHSAKMSSFARLPSSSAEKKECETLNTGITSADEPECSCVACSRWKQPQVVISSDDNTVAEKCDPEWVPCGYYSDLGALCEACAGKPLLDGTCCRHHDEQASTLSSFDTLYSFSADCSKLSRDTSSEHLCRICHCTSAPDDPLISPCRCSGTLKFVHMTCLLHWLTICSRKLRRPPICELCLYKYRRRRSFKWRDVRLPSVPRRDLGYLSVFVVAITLMFLSAAMSFVCFYIERKFGIVGHPKSSTMAPEAREWENVLSSATLASAVVFFLGLFIAMYAHVKTEISFARYVIQWWRCNHEWTIEEYRASRDERYTLKLEQLRHRINGVGTQAASIDERVPLQTTVLE